MCKLPRFLFSVGVALCMLLVGASVFAAEKYYGVGVHLASGQSDARSVRAFLSTLQLNSFRDDLQWNNLETVRGQYAFRGGMAAIEDLITGRTGTAYKPLLILDYDNALYFTGLPKTDLQRAAFAAYARAMFQRFDGRVVGFEVWNEWNMGAGDRSGQRGSPADYVKLLKAVRAQAQSVNLKAPLIAGVVGEREMAWIEEFVLLGGLQYCDGFSVHPYNHTARDASAEEIALWLDTLDRKLRAINQGKSVPIYISEIGWPTHDAGWSEAVVRDRALKLLLLLHAKPYVAGVWWYDLFDDGPSDTTREHRFGLVRQSQAVKPAFSAVKTFMETYAKKNVVRSSIDSNGVIIEFSETVGTSRFVVWKREGSPPLMAVATRSGTADLAYQTLPDNPEVIRAANTISVRIQAPATAPQLNVPAGQLQQ